MRAAGRVGFWLLVAAIAAFSLLPLLYALVTSLRPGSELFTVAYWPAQATLANYAAVFAGQPFGRNILNSLVVASAVVGLSLALGAIAAFAIGRVAFRGRSLLLAAILATSMFPQIAVLSGLFELLRALGLYNRLPGLVLADLLLTLPFTVWMLTTFMREVPKEIEEAAIIDGAGALTILVRVFLPLVAPAAVSTGLLAFVVAWNEFLFALTFTLTDEQRTVPVAIALMTGETAFELPWGMIMAASVIVTVPVAALVLVFQRRIVSGLTMGSLKG
jgi:trehalose/maltose transport system permease protein